MQPYNKNTLRLLVITLIAFASGYFMPTLPNFIIDIAIRSSIVGGLFILLIYKMQATPELNNKIRKQLNWISKKAN
jgi:hypothetical protein